jgi:hypothetical protein
MSIITGCNASPSVIPFEQDSIDIKAEMPLERCTWPELHEEYIDNEHVVYMDAEGLKLQTFCQVTEQTNYEIAVNNANSTNDAIEAFNK